MASSFLTTAGWHDRGELDQGYDVGLVVLAKRTGIKREIGADTGHFGFCHTDGLQPNWAPTRLGYPSNYHQGAQMTQGEHLERSNGRDFLHGSGMRGGSSGGPHIVNSGEISDPATSRGLFTARNGIFAVTSWGYVRRELQGPGCLLALRSPQRQQLPEDVPSGLHQGEDPARARLLRPPLRRAGSLRPRATVPRPWPAAGGPEGSLAPRGSPAP